MLKKEMFQGKCVSPGLQSNPSCPIPQSCGGSRRYKPMQMNKEKKYDPCDFNCGMVVGVKRAGLSHLGKIAVIFTKD